MFSQRFLRLPPALRATSHLRSASKPSPAPFLHQRPNPSFIRHYAYPPPGSPPPRRPPRVIHYRFDPNGASRAKPLITVEQVNNVVRSPRFLYICLFASGSAAVFYFMNLEEVPVSGRKRFNCYSEATVEKEGERMYRMIMAEAAQNRAIVPPSDRRSKMVARVLSRLIEAQGLQHVNWEVHVIESDEQNAFVIPGGKVFVYSGILPICRDDDGLAAVLGHEIAHNLAQHAAESMSSRIMLEPIRWALIFADSAGFTLGLGRYLGEIALNLGIAMPASRKQESEADYIGLMMMAKACYNPEAAVGLWERMEKAKEAEPPEWLSTHPSNANRIMNMEQWLAKAIDTRNESNCAATIGHARDFQSTFGDFGPFFGGVFR